MVDNVASGTAYRISNSLSGLDFPFPSSLLLPQFVGLASNLPLDVAARRTMVVRLGLPADLFERTLAKRPDAVEQILV